MGRASFRVPKIRAAAQWCRIKPLVSPAARSNHHIRHGLRPAERGQPGSALPPPDRRRWIMGLVLSCKALRDVLGFHEKAGVCQAPEACVAVTIARLQHSATPFALLPSA